MSARSRTLTLCLALALAACGSSSAGGTTGTTVACGPKNCAGCCDGNGVCQLPADDQCGLKGAQCVACMAAEVCRGGACVVPSSAGTTTGSTTGGASSATTGAGASSGSSGGATTGSSTTGGTSTSASSTSGTSTSGSGSSGTTGGSGSSGGSTTGSDCCLVLNCPSGCDPTACACLGAGTTTGSGTTGGGTTTGTPDAGGICTSQNCVVYAESARTLYQVDPNPPNAISQICDFNGDIHADAGVNDIAVTRNGALYGITKNDLFTIDPRSCAGTYLASLAANHGDYNCLTFTNQDTLLAADGNGQVVTIDVNTGNVADAGHFGGNLGCSGDIVALSDGTIYATAKQLNSSTADDLLVTLDPAQGYLATPVSANTLGYKGIFGLGYWAGTLYGFDKSGHTLSINPVQGTASILHTNTGVVFYGAGTTPLAPVVITH